MFLVLVLQTSTFVMHVSWVAMLDFLFRLLLRMLRMLLTLFTVIYGHLLYSVSLDLSTILW